MLDLKMVPAPTEWTCGDRRITIPVNPDVTVTFPFKTFGILMDEAGWAPVIPEKTD